MEQRPKTVPIVAAFLFAAAAIAAVVGTSLVFPNTLLDQLWDFNKRGAAAFHALGWIAGALLLALGGATCAAASGLLRRKQWAWWFTIVLFAIDGTGDVISFSVTGDFLRSASGAAISLAFLYALSRHRVIRYFKQPR
jgi:uncharacterized membrane protein (DUF2068 family)